MEETEKWTIVFYTLAVVIHIFAFILLLRMRSTPTFSHQQKLLLLHMDIAAIFCSVLAIIKTVLEIYGSSMIGVYFFYATIVGVPIYYFGSMILINVDRFLRVYFALRYDILCTTKKTIMSCLIVFVIAVLMAISVLYAKMPDGLGVAKNLIYGVNPAIDVIFACTAFVTYSYLIVRIYQNKREERIQRARLFRRSESRPIKEIIQERINF